MWDSRLESLPRVKPRGPPEQSEALPTLPSRYNNCRAASHHPRKPNRRRDSRSSPLHPAPENYPSHHHRRRVRIHPPHRPHPARMRLARRRRAGNRRPAPADHFFLARLHNPGHVLVPQCRHPRDEQQQLRRRIHGTHHPQIRIRRRQGIQQPQRRSRPARPAPRPAARLGSRLHPRRPARPTLQSKAWTGSSWRAPPPFR